MGARRGRTHLSGGSGGAGGEAFQAPTSRGVEARERRASREPQSVTPLRIDIASQSISLFPARGVLWHERSTLLVADLHLGRQQAWRAGGVPISGEAQIASLDEPLERLSMLLRATGARRLLILGDLLHAPAGLTEAMIERVAEWRREHGACRVEVVPGNHDRGLDRVRDAWSLGVLEAIVREPPFVFVHDPADVPTGEPEPLVACCGHVHPMVRLSSRGDAVRAPAFFLSPRRLLLPAFSGMNSGATVSPLPSDRVFAIAGSRMIDLGVRAKSLAQR